ncbi:MAG: DegV family protein [Erysipelotrichaceae bacterium]|nr:DegV family protein [Erysipelotrichaceae bacterium]MBQ7888455.1 DegV family protein [Erysipelotrichaceae bacterium]
MKFKIVADSASNVYELENTNYQSVPLKIITDKEYVDDKHLNVFQMAMDIKAYKGKSGTSCPNSAEWLEAFQDAEYIFGVAITSRLSGSYNSAVMAAKEYTEAHPERKVHIVDSLSTGPHMKMIVEKLVDLINSGDSFEEIKNQIEEYTSRTHLVFSLQSVDNLARNGRVNPAVAMAVNALGIRIVGEAFDGQLAQRNKCRGEKKALQVLFNNMKEMGYKGGRVSIGHNFNEKGAETLKELILSEFPQCNIEINVNHGLNCFYAELGGILVGFEAF